MSTPLTGGRLTKGVVRVGDTVRRPASPFTADLLNLLGERGLDIVPRHLGQDEEGRDILTYLDGWVPTKFQPWADEQVAAAGRLLRAWVSAIHSAVDRGRRQPDARATSPRRAGWGAHRAGPTEEHPRNTRGVCACG